jgi:uncharacterized membrane protein (GlpM family)
LKKTVDPRLLALYFVIGGLVVALVTYFGSQGRSELAVFIAFLPATTLITLITIYLAGGTGAAVSYAKSMLILLPAWILYVVAVILLLPRVGLTLSLVVSVAAYLGAAFLTMKLT